MVSDKCKAIPLVLILFLTVTMSGCMAGKKESGTAAVIQPGSSVSDGAKQIDWDAEIAAQTKEIERDPQRWEAYLARGKAYAGKGMQRESYRDFTKAIELKPESAEAYFQRALLNTKEDGSADQPLSDYDRVIERNPKCAEAYQGIGWMYMVVVHRGSSKMDVVQAGPMMPPLSSAFRNSDYKEYVGLAIEACSKAIELNSQFAQAYHTRGNAYREAGKFHEAMADYNRALELKPNSAEVYKDRGDAYIRAGQNDLAIEDCTQAIKLNPQLVEGYNYRSLAYAAKSQLDLAIADCDRAISLKQDYMPGYYNKAQLYERLGRTAEAIAAYREFIKYDKQGYERYKEQVQKRLAELGG